MLHTIKVKTATVLVLTLGLLGCNATPSTNEQTNIDNATPSAATASNTAATGDRPLVVATTSVICDMTEQIAGETVDLNCLVDAGKDPHVYQPTSEDRKAIEKANLILYGGYDFEPSIIKLIKATSNNAPKAAVHEEAVTQPILGEAHDHDHEKGETHAEDENVPDPHVWHNAQNGIRMVETIRNSLTTIAPSHTALYSSNAKKLTDELTQIDTWIKSQVSTIPVSRRKLVTTHDALSYYVNAYGLSYEGALSGLSTEEAPTATRVSELVKDIRKSNVPTIFTETSVNPRLIEAVARDAKVKVSDRELFTDGLGEKGTEGDTYQKMLIANTRTIVEGLGGQYTPFEPTTANQP
jgi:manganese/iron transport system substrate-binding protein